MKILNTSQHSKTPLYNCEDVHLVLGSTNTGKTYTAIERMLGHKSGMLGLPLRLLAREVYDKVVKRAGIHAVALITGEEKILPKNPSYYICTVEAMPSDVSVNFMCIDECQLAADGERGHVFTDRILNWRGTEETWLLGAATMQPILKKLLPKAQIIIRPRLSKLSYGGMKKLSRLPPRTAVVAFSQSDVYAIAELLRRQKGGAAVVLGALSPHTRNKQVELFQNGDVDVLVATDAIGMGLNLDIKLVSFASTIKFDGYKFRNLTPSEIGQIAGRAGRYMTDGEFGVTANVDGFEPELIDRVENHLFEPVSGLQWRNNDLRFASLNALKESLNQRPSSYGLFKARAAEDVIALENATLSRDVLGCIDTPQDIELLWNFCQIPDYRKLSPSSHADLISTLFCMMQKKGNIDTDWFATRFSEVNRLEGNIETLSNRISQSRTWNYIANHNDWIIDAPHWQALTRALELRLSDALHEKLMQRFTTRGTQKLIQALGDTMDSAAKVSENDEIIVDGNVIGTVKGLKFSLNADMMSENGKAYQKAATALAESIIQKRIDEILIKDPSVFTLNNAGDILWYGHRLAQLKKGSSPYLPDVQLFIDTPHVHMRDAVRVKVLKWLNDYIKQYLPAFFPDEALLNEAPAAIKSLQFKLAEGYGWLPKFEFTVEERAAIKEARTQFKPFGLYEGKAAYYCSTHMSLHSRMLSAHLKILFESQEIFSDIEPIYGLIKNGRSVLNLSEDTKLHSAIHALGFVPLKTHAIRLDVLEWLLKTAENEFFPFIARKKAAALVEKSKVVSEVAATSSDPLPTCEGAVERSEIKGGILVEEENKPLLQYLPQGEGGSDAPVIATVPQLDAETLAKNAAHTAILNKLGLTQAVYDVLKAEIFELIAKNSAAYRQNKPVFKKPEFKKPEFKKSEHKKSDKKPFHKPIQKAEPKPVKIDPNSPFAVLQLLTKDMDFGRDKMNK